LLYAAPLLIGNICALRRSRRPDSVRKTKPSGASRGFSWRFHWADRLM